jgi:hypothetical protein
MVTNPTPPPAAAQPFEPKPQAAQPAPAEATKGGDDDSFDPLGAFLQDLDAEPQSSAKAAAPAAVADSSKATDRFADDDDDDDDDDLLDLDDFDDLDDLDDLDDIDELNEFALDLDDKEDDDDVLSDNGKRASEKAAADTEERFLDLLEDEPPSPKPAEVKQPEPRAARPPARPEPQAPRSGEQRGEQREFKARPEQQQQQGRPEQKRPEQPRGGNSRQGNQQPPAAGVHPTPTRPKIAQPAPRGEDRNNRHPEKHKNSGQPNQPARNPQRDDSGRERFDRQPQGNSKPQHNAAQGRPEQKVVAPPPPAQRDDKQREDKQREYDRQQQQPVASATPNNGPRTNKMKPGRLFGWLVSYESPDGRAIELRAGRFFITGTSIRGTDLILEDQSISTPHALMSITDNGLQIQDLMSERGTFIRSAGDTQYRREDGIIDVRHGDWIRFGDVEFLVTIVPS